MFKINGKNAFGSPLRLGLFFKVECMNLSETNWLWQGAICHVWTFQFDKHWQHSQKQLQKYNVKERDIRDDILMIFKSVQVQHTFKEQIVLLLIKTSNSTKHRKLTYLGIYLLTHTEVLFQGDYRRNFLPFLLSNFQVSMSLEHKHNKVYQGWKHVELSVFHRGNSLNSTHF